MELYNEEAFQRLDRILQTAVEGGSPRALAMVTGNRAGDQKTLNGGFHDDSKS